jgi:hypothetical protein
MYEGATPPKAAHRTLPWIRRRLNPRRQSHILCTKFAIRKISLQIALIQKK